MLAMKTLVLASAAGYIVPALAGLFSRPFSELRFAVVPTAANGEPGPKPWYDAEIQVLHNLGINTVEITLEESRQSDLELRFSGIDAVYVAGGNTFYLLHHARQSGFDKLLPALLERGLVYIGSSAGSVIAGNTIEIAYGQPHCCRNDRLHRHQSR